MFEQPLPQTQTYTNSPVPNKSTYKRKLFTALGVLILIPILITIFILNTNFTDDKLCAAFTNDFNPFCISRAADPSVDKLTNLLGLSIDPNNKNNVGGNPKIEELNELNVKWVRIEYIENPVISFKDLFANLRQNNKKVLVILDYKTIASVQKPDSRTIKAGDPAWATYRQKFVQKVKQVVDEHKDSVDAWEIWNEPDLYVDEKYDPLIPPQEYAKFLKEASDVIKLSGAKGTLVVGGLASGNVNYLKEVIKAYGNNLTDYGAVGIHPYGQRPDNFDTKWGFGHIDTFINTYYAATGKPLWITEIGTDDQAVQADYLTKFYKTIIAKHLAKVPVVIWFCYSDAMVKPFGLLEENGNKKQTYYSYKMILPTNGDLPAASIYDPPPNATLSSDKGTFKLSMISGSPLKYRLTIKKPDNTIPFWQEINAKDRSFSVHGLPTDGSKLTATVDTIYTGITVSTNQIYYSFSAPSIPSGTNSNQEEPNWAIKIYENTELSGTPTVIKDEPPSTEPGSIGGIFYDWGWNISPDKNRLPFKVNDYSIRFDRQKQFDAGTYKFKLLVDQGAKVYVDNILVLDKWTISDFNTVYESSNINISAGIHRITVAYFEKSDQAKIKFWWEKVGGGIPTPTPSPSSTPTGTLTPTPSPSGIPTPINNANKPAELITPTPASGKISASTTTLNLVWNLGKNAKTYDVKVTSEKGATVKEVLGILGAATTQSYQVNLSGMTELNINLKTNFNDGKNEAKLYKFSVISDFTAPQVDNTTSIIKFNAVGTASLNVAPAVNLVVERSGIKTTIESQNITLQKDYEFKLPYKLHTTDKVYFYFCNDTSNDGKCAAQPGSANRDLVFNYVIIDNVTVKLKQKVILANGTLGVDADIKYDRANREDGSLYDNGKIRDVSSSDGNFGTYSDNKAVMYGGEKFSWNDTFNGFMPFNGAIVVGINWEQ